MMVLAVCCLLAAVAGFGETERKAFNGLLSVIVRAKPGVPGKIRIRVESEGLASAEGLMDVK